MPGGSIFDLFVRIGADISGLTAGLQAAATQTQTAAGQMGGSLAGVGTAAQGATAATNTLSNALNGVAVAANTAQKASAQLASEMNRQAGALAGIGAAITAAFAVPAVALGASVSAFAEFDAAMTKSLAIQDNVSSSMRDKMAAAAIDLSTTLNVSAKDGATAFYYLASAGYSVEQQIAALPVVARFAKAGMVDMKEATATLTTVQNALGMASTDAATNLKNLAAIGDIIVKADTVAETTTKQLADALLNKAATAAKTFGISLLDTVVILEAYAKAGIKGAQAGTYFQIAVNQLQQAVNKHGKAWQDLGIAVYDASGKLRPLADIMVDLSTKLSGYSDKAKFAELATLGFQQRSNFSILPLVGMANKLADLRAATQDYGGTAERVAQKQMQTFNEQVALMHNKVTAIEIAIGKALVPTLNLLMGALNPLLDGLRESVKVFQSMPTWVQTTSLAVTALTVGAALLLGALLLAGAAALSLGASLISLTGTTTIMAALGVAGATVTSAFAAAGPVLATVGLIAVGLAATFMELRDLGKDVLSITGFATYTEAWKAVKDLLDEATFAAKAYVTQVANIITTRPAGAMSGAIWDEVSVAIKGVTFAVQGATTWFKEIYKWTAPQHWYELIGPLGIVALAFGKIRLAMAGITGGDAGAAKAGALMQAQAQALSEYFKVLERGAPVTKTAGKSQEQLTQAYEEAKTQLEEVTKAARHGVEGAVSVAEATKQESAAFAALHPEYDHAIKSKKELAAGAKAESAAQKEAGKAATELKDAYEKLSLTSKSVHEAEDAVGRIFAATAKGALPENASAMAKLDVLYQKHIITLPEFLALVKKLGEDMVKSAKSADAFHVPLVAMTEDFAKVMQRGTDMLGLLPALSAHMLAFEQNVMGLSIPTSQFDILNERIVGTEAALADMTGATGPDSVAVAHLKDNLDQLQDAMLATQDRAAHAAEGLALLGTGAITSSVSFATLGLQSQATLQKLADQAYIAYRAIAQNANSSAFDSDRAWLAYYDDARRAGDTFTEATIAQTERIRTRVQGTIRDLSDSWANLGKKIKDTIANDLSRDISSALGSIVFPSNTKIPVREVQAVADFTIETGGTGPVLEAVIKKLESVTTASGGSFSTIAKSAAADFKAWSIATGDQAAALDRLFSASVAGKINFSDLLSTVGGAAKTFQALGFSADQAAAFIAQLNLKGEDSKQVVDALTKTYDTFTSQGLPDAGAALRDVISKIQTAGDAAHANVIGLQYFGTEGATMARIIRGGALDVNSLVTSIAAMPASADKTANSLKAVTSQTNALNDAFKKLGQDVLNIILDKIIKQGINALIDSLASATGWVGTLGKALGGISLKGIPGGGGVLGTGVGAATGGGGFGSAPGITTGELNSLGITTPTFSGAPLPGAGAATGAAGAAGSLGSTATGFASQFAGNIIAAVGVGIQAISGIVTGMQLSHIGSDVNFIEKSTRYIKIGFLDAGGLLDQFTEWRLAAEDQYSWERAYILGTLREIRDGIKGIVSITLTAAAGGSVQDLGKSLGTYLASTNTAQTDTLLDATYALNKLLNATSDGFSHVVNSINTMSGLLTGQLHSLVAAQGGWLGTIAKVGDAISGIGSLIGGFAGGIVGGTLKGIIGGIVGGFTSGLSAGHDSSLLGRIEESTRYAQLFLGGRGDQGILGVLFKIQENVSFGPLVKACEATRDLLAKGFGGGSGASASEGFYDFGLKDLDLIQDHTYWSLQKLTEIAASLVNLASGGLTPGITPGLTPALARAGGGDTYITHIAGIDMTGEPDVDALMRQVVKVGRSRGLFKPQ